MPITKTVYTRIPCVLLSLSLACTLAFASPQSAQTTSTATEKSSQPTSSSKVDVNSASQKELEALPGVGAASAKKIIAGRPYGSVSDLQKAGLSAKTVEKITPLVTAGGGAPSPNASASATKPDSGKSNSPQSATSGTSAKVDLNAASQQELQALPGVGAATAKKIIANRPYASLDDLSKSGISKSKIDKLSGLVSVGSAPASTPQKTADSAKSSSKESNSGVAQSSASPTGANSAHASPGAMAQNASDSAATAQQPPQPGMVWANLDTKVYHQPGHRWYGKTKHGQFMTEQDAIKAGFHASKE